MLIGLKINIFLLGFQICEQKFEMIACFDL